MAELARNRKVKYDTLYRKARRKFPSEIWDAESVVRPEHIAVLFPEKRELIRRKRKAMFTAEQQPDYIQPAPAEPGAPDTPPARQGWRLFDLPALLAVVIYAHTLLVWYEIATIFVMPGVFAGVILAAMKHAAVVVVRSGKFGDAVYHVLGIAFLLDALAWYVHFTAFFAALRESRYMTEMGQNSYAVAGVLAAVVCSGAFVALFLIHKIKSQQ